MQDQLSTQDAPQGRAPHLTPAAAALSAVAARWHKAQSAGRDPITCAPWSALSLQCSERALSLQRQLPTVLPALHLGLLTITVPDAASNQPLGTIATPLWALNEVERARLTSFTPSSIAPSSFAPSAEHDATISLTCTPASLDPSAPNLAQIDSAAQPVLFELMPQGESLCVVGVRPISAVERYELLALLTAYNSAFIQIYHRATPSSTLLAQAAQLLTQCVAASRLDYLDLMAVAALSIARNSSHARQRADQAQLIVASPWLKVLSAALAPSPNATVAPDLSALTGALSACQHYLQQPGTMWLSAVGAHLPLSTLTLASITELKHQLRAGELGSYLGAKPQVLPHIIAALSAATLYHLAQHDAHNPQLHLLLCCEQLLHSYLGALLRPAPSSERGHALHTLIQQLHGTEALSCELSVVAAYLGLSSVLQSASGPDFAAALAELAPERALLALFTSELSLDPERTYAALGHGLSELVPCCSDLDALEAQISAALSAAPSTVPSNPPSATAATAAAAAAALLSAYQAQPERFSALLTAHPQLIAAGLTELNPEDQAALLSALSKQLPAQPEAAWLCGLSAALDGPLLTRWLSALNASAPERAACRGAALLTTLAEPDAPDAEPDTERLAALLAPALVHPELEALWAHAHKQLLKLSARALASLASALTPLLSAPQAQLSTYLQRADAHALNLVLKTLAQALRLVPLSSPENATNEVRPFSRALSAQPEALAAWLYLVHSVGLAPVAAALSTAEADCTWCAALWTHAKSESARRTCWELLPPSTLAQLPLPQITALMALITKPTARDREQLLALCQAGLSLNLMDYTEAELNTIYQLLQQSAAVEPELYSQLLKQTDAERLGLVVTNLMILGRHFGAVAGALGDALLALSADLRPILQQAQERPSLGGKPNVLGSMLESMVSFKLQHQEPDALRALLLLSPSYASRCLLQHQVAFGRWVEQPPAADLTPLAQLLATLIKTQSSNATVLSWVRAWRAQPHTAQALSTALSQIISPEALMELDGTNQDSLELLALLPQPLRLAHARLLMASPHFAAFCAHELGPIIAPLTAVLTDEYLSGSLELLGLTPTYDWAPQWRLPEEKRALATACLTLCCALSDKEVRAQRPALSTALLADAPSELLSAVATLSAPDFAPLMTLLPKRLYQSAAREQPWLRPLTLALAHKVGCPLSHLSEELGSYLFLGPPELTPKLAALTPLLPSSALATVPAAPVLSLEDWARARREQELAPLTLSDLNATAPHDRMYLIKSALPLLEPAAPALYELLRLALKGAPGLVALSALPPPARAPIATALGATTTSSLVLSATELKALRALVVSAAELAAAGIPVAVWGELRAWDALTPEQLQGRHVLLVGTTEELENDSLMPHALALGLNPYDYQQQGQEDLTLALEQYSEQLNVLSRATAHRLLQVHGDTTSATAEHATEHAAENVEENEVEPRVILTQQLDGTINLYTVAAAPHRALWNACASVESMELTPAIWDENAGELPLFNYVSTTEPPSGTNAPAEALPEAASALARDLEQGSADPGLLAARCSYRSRVRARYFAAQVALLVQLAALHPEQPLCYLIEYERDVAPLKAYLDAHYPELSARTQLLSLSALEPDFLCADTKAPTSDADQVLAALPEGALIVINSLELNAHQDLVELSAGQSVQRSLYHLGLGGLSAHLTTLQAALRAGGTRADQALLLILVHGLSTALYLKLGGRLNQFHYYLLEPALNEGWDTPSNLDSLVRLLPCYLKPFASRADKLRAQELAQPFFSATTETAAALASLESMAQHLAQTAPSPVIAANEPELAPESVPHAEEAAVPSAVVTAHSPLLLNPQQGAEVLARLEGNDEAAQLELTKALRAISHMFIGGHEWRSYQLTALPPLIKRSADALISLPTGGGKSVLFQGPAWYRSFYSGRLSVVITPLRALMVDQVRALRAKNYLSVDYLSSDRPSYETRQVLERIRSGVTTLLYITPERLRSRYFVKLLTERYEQDGKQGEFFIFDEAHCISQWGKEFRPDYIYAAQLIAQLRSEYNFNVIMCSATMTTQVVTDLEQYLRPEHLLLGEIGTNYNPIRPHIGLSTQEVPSDLHNRVAAIIDFIRKEHIDFEQSRMLVFCQLRHSTEALCVALESYAAHLNYLYHYQQRHPDFKFEPEPLTEVLRKLDDQPSYLSSIELGSTDFAPDFAANFASNSASNLAPESDPNEPTTELERKLTELLAAMDQAAQEEEAASSFGAAVEVQENERYAQEASPTELFASDSALKQRLSAALTDENSFSYRPNKLHELCCDVAVIDPDDPILKLAAHVGFFHAQMSARAREHVFTRYQENSERAIAAQVKSQSALWFNDQAALNERSGSTLEQSLLSSNQPLYLLCATKAFGMGMDLPNIHYVLHAEPSAVFEDYLQEVGRAGRSQAQYEAAFPQDPVTGARALLPALCLYHQEDFDKAMERLNKSLISWDHLMLADDLVRTYVSRFGPLSAALTEPVVVPSDLFARDVSQVLAPSDPENISNKALAHNSTLLFYHLEDLGRIKLGFRAPCPLQLTLVRTPFTQLKRNQDGFSFAPNDTRNAAPSTRLSAREQLALNCVITVLQAQLEDFDQAYRTTDEANTNEADANAAVANLSEHDLPEHVALIFDLQYFLQQCNHNTPLKQRLSLASTVNALLELMAAGALNLNLPFSLSFNLGHSVDYARRFNQAEVQYYVSRAVTTPELTAPVLPHLNLTLRLCALILERSYADFRAEIKRRSEANTLERFAPSRSKEPLPDYPGLGFTNNWLTTTLRELIAPYADEFMVEGDIGLEGNPAVPWLTGQGARKRDLNTYLEHHLLPDVKSGVSALLQLMPHVKLTKAAAANDTTPATLVVKTWSESFYLLLDLLYEDSWHLLTELNRTQGLNPVTTTAVTFARLAENADVPPDDSAQDSTEPESAPPKLPAPTYLNNWAEIVFALGLRHESSDALLSNYELSQSRSHVREWYLELSRELNTYGYFSQLLAFLQAVGLIRHSALISHGYELTVTEECVERPLDSAPNLESPFFQRRKQFELLAQFKRARLALMQVYCQEVSDDKRRLFIEEFFKSQDYGDYIKHIGNFSDANSSILSEITASNLALEEEKLRANPEQWAVYQSPVDLSLNVMAGPGSGKTHLLALRCVRLIYQEHVAPESVLILAYNRAVVVELKTRLDRLFTNLGLRKIGRKLAIFTFHSLAKVCLGNALNDIDPNKWECTLITQLKAQPQLFIKRFGALRYIMIDEFQDITHARLELLHLLKQCYRTPLYLFTIGDINQSIYGFNRVANMLQDPNATGNCTISAAQYAACLGPEPYYRNLARLFEPTTLSLKLNYRSFPKILARAEPYALNPEYTARSAPLLEKYAPPKTAYCALFDVTNAAIYQAQRQQRRIRYWAQDLSNIISGLVKKSNEKAQLLAQEAAAQLGLQDSAACERYEQLIFAAAALSANSAAAQRAQQEAPTLIARTVEGTLTPAPQAAPAPQAVSAPKEAPAPEALPAVPRPHSADELLLRSKYLRITSLALFFRTNNEVYRALEQVQALPPEILAQVEVRVQGSSSIALWREREYYALAHFIKAQGAHELKLGPVTTKLTAAALPLHAPLEQLYAQLQPLTHEDSATALKLLTQSLMERYPNWDQAKLDMAYCLALSFNATMISGITYTWSDLLEYYLDLLTRDDGGHCYKLYESMAGQHLVRHQRVSLTLSTMHKVKGLEYDLVLIPPSTADLPLMSHDYLKPEPGQPRFIKGSYGSNEQEQWAAYNLPLSADEQADLAEERRLYYVAYTRARKYLYLYYGERERALDENRRFITPDSQLLWSENDDSVDNYVISFNASAARAGINDYIARHVKVHDPVLIVAQGDHCYIQHQAQAQTSAQALRPGYGCGAQYGAQASAPLITIGRLSAKSKIRAQMQAHHVATLTGLFVSTIVVWTYEDTVKADIKRLHDAIAQQQSFTPQLQGLKQEELDLSDAKLRAALAARLNVNLFAPYWAPEVAARGYCYLVLLAGRGTPHGPAHGPVS